MSGFLVNPSANTVASVLVTGTGIFSTIIDNCFINNASSNANAHAIHCNNTAATSPVIRINKSIIKTESNANNAIRGERGDWRLALSYVESQATPSAGSQNCVLLENNAVLSGGNTVFESANTAAVIACSGTMPGTTKISIAWCSIVNSSNTVGADGVSALTSGLTVSIAYGYIFVRNTSTSTAAIRGVTGTVFAVPYCSYPGNSIQTVPSLGLVTQDVAAGDLAGRYPSPTIRTGAVTTAKLAAGAVTSTILATNAVETLKIRDAQVTQAKLSLTSPVNATDAATKQYVDNLTLGLSWKDVVALVATSAVTTSGAQTIDGQATTDQDRVLLTAQVDGKDNGIYVVSHSGVWSRSTDLAVGASAAGTAVLVAKGDTLADTQWICTTDAPNDIVAANALTFIQFGVGTSYTAGDGLDLVGSEFVVLAADSSIEVSAGGVKAATLSFFTQEVNPISATAGDGSSTGITVQTLPCGNGVIHVFVNGLRVSVGNGVMTKDAYFSNDGGATARTYASIIAGDELIWNGVIAGYELAVTDEVSFVYQDM
jgi:hypothetical protein